MILLVDNYDSFTFNIVQGLWSAGAEVELRANDDPELLELDPARFSGLVLGPGPGRPEGAGLLMSALARFYDRFPTLGICLGMQAIALHHGALIRCAPRPFHGRIESVEHDGEGLFHGLSSPIQATRYHSLCIDPATLPQRLQVSARSEDGVIMAFRDTQARAGGFQFHPESIASPRGLDLLSAFVRSTL